ncbi:unnamed protein product [Ixodes pacificus]
MATPASNDVPSPFQNRPKGLATIASVIVGLLVAVVYLGLLIVFATNHVPFEQHTPSSNLTYCCPNLAAELVKAANFSLDPCTNFLNYTCYNFHRLRGDVVDPVTNMAVLGVRMAFSFWTIILGHQGWNPISKARITGTIGCYPHITIERFSDLVTFRLALKSAATAARTMVTGWNVGLKAWSIQTLSPAQMFYMRSVFVYCDDWKTGRDPAVYLDIDDFRSTFACPPRQQGWAKNCSYDL